MKRVLPEYHHQSRQQNGRDRQNCNFSDNNTLLKTLEEERKCHISITSKTTRTSLLIIDYGGMGIRYCNKKQPSIFQSINWK